MKKVIKKLKKMPKTPSKYIKKAWDELVEEAEDFFDDLYEDIFQKKKPQKKLKQIKVYGMSVMARPAYVFAERVENVLKLVFGVSIFVSGVIATFWGFTRTSVLLEALIRSIYGRILIVIIGISYFILGLWKLFHLHK
ncbi:hypothetical protein JXC34_05605 [Candidatus Woesearchaeota archaeon]|nr:hypothetical protein [Candidatus Woesearchaeota archaeon]